jgi:glycosyltransferase involved in cell wall biosynthesis
MRKKKILWVNEASWKGTGYGTYGNEILTRLHKVEEFEIAELACYIDRDDPEIHNRPWKVYPNRPLESDPEFANYVQNPSRVFGEQTFNHVLIDFMPDIVMDIRDWWMFEFEQRSPFRDFFHWAIMPTVDAMPQNSQWMNTFSDADSIFAYSEFGKQTLLEQSDQINFVDIASPAAGTAFKPVPDKAAHKDAMGLDANSVIIGTVMRNQRRKLYPDLFNAFRTFLDSTKRSNVFLHCHKYYPDIGWETPELLDAFGLNNRVLFTYRCTDCKTVSIDFYKDTVCYCNNCKQLSRKLAGVDNSVNDEELNKIYNTFDMYIQYANSEGFGMPQLEAAFCGLPVISIDYSAMESVSKNIGAASLKPLSLSMECETGCYRAIPNNNELAQLMQVYTADDFDLKTVGQNIERLARSQYDWDKTAQVWIDHFKSIPVKDVYETWLSPIQIKEPNIQMPSGITDLVDQVSFMFENILHKPEWIGGYFWGKVIKDITFGYRVYNAEDDYYFNESHLPKVEKYQKFNMLNAVEELINMRKLWNDYERLRGRTNENRV